MIKIDYENGAGDGHVIWRLGQGGDFTVNSTDASPWFSGQHDAHFIDASTLIVFDDGNTRQASDPTAHSRGQVWKLDEQTMTATLVFNVDLGGYSPMFGSAQRLSNGDYSFLSGAQGTAPHQIGQSIEVRPDGSTAYVLAVNKGEYRSFRIQTLYQGISDQLAPVPTDASSGLPEISLNPIDDAALNLELLATEILFNWSIGGAGGSGGSAGQGVGGGLYVAPSGAAYADARTVVFGNFNSSSDDDVFGTLGVC